MRPFRRPNVTLPTLGAQGSGGKKRASQVEDYEDRGERQFKFPEHWTRPDVRGALYAMHGRVCGYCGADVSDMRGDVEHFRPKSCVREDDKHGGYWWLAYEFSNYLLSCGLCNRTYKNDRFPMQRGGVHLGYGERGKLAAELRVLLDPCCDEIEELVTVDWSKPACKVVAKPGLSADETARVEQVLEFFHINCARHRKKRLEMQRLVIGRLDENRGEEVRRLAIRYRPHSLVAKVILEEKAKALLPGPEEELEWLLDDLASELIETLEDLGANPNPTEIDDNEAKELFWALAVLWKDPPACTRQFVEDFLAARGLKDDVKVYFDLL